MGCPGYGAHLHVSRKTSTLIVLTPPPFLPPHLPCLYIFQIDQVGNPSWQAQVKGTKKWTLEPPPECAHQCPPRMETIIHPGEISKCKIMRNAEYSRTIPQGTQEGMHCILHKNDYKGDGK